jgi:hypothetical protein
MSIDLVIARYAEDLGFVDRLPHRHAFRRILVYNKGDPLVHLPAGASEFFLENVGRIDHTILYHLVHSEDLADVTVFLPASCESLPKKWARARAVIERAVATRRSVFFVSGRTSEWEHFTQQTYMCHSPANAMANQNFAVHPADVRPFGEWYRTHFKEVGVRPCALLGIFALSKVHAHTRPRDFLTGLIAQLEVHHNPEVGHYVERSWLAIFRVDHSCLYNINPPMAQIFAAVMR